jgi:hypothetical protein
MSELGKAARSGHKALEAAIRVAVRGFGLKKRPTLLPLIRSDFASSPTPLVQLHIREAPSWPSFETHFSRRPPL